MFKEFFSKLFGKKDDRIYTIPNTNHNTPKKGNVHERFHFHEYTVRGKNPKTNRMKTKCVVAKEGSSNDEIAIKSGFLEPITIELSEGFFDSPPSEKEIAYAKSLDIKIPNGCTFADLSCLIAKKKHEDSDDFISVELAEYAAKFDVCLSAYSGTLQGIMHIMHELHKLDGRDCLAFWAYIFYCVTENKKIYNLDNVSNRNTFYHFADTFIGDEAIIKTIKSLDYENFEYFFTHKMFDRRNKAKAYLAEKTKDFLF